MKLGIDFGTTRLVTAAVDRGNYPVVKFETPDGVTEDWFPTLIAMRGHERRYGWEAFALQGNHEWTMVRSLKRFLGAAGPHTHVRIDDESPPMQLLLAELTAKLKQELLEHSTLSAAKRESLEICLGVPANANSNQRFLAVEAFRQSGFEVLGLLNEPSAASIEYGHLVRQSGKSGKDGNLLLVYDLGGGTFDASLVELGDRTHTVMGSEGVASLGGDDFDDILAEMALDKSGVSGAILEELHQGELFRLHEECRRKKEALHPNSRKLVVELDTVRDGWGEVSVQAADFYERCRPLVEETLQAVDDLLARHGIETASGTASGEDRRLEAVYVAGGGSELPLVPRALRERFGRRVRRSAHARSTTAIGLAIQADGAAGYKVRESFTRYFGVWREAEAGDRIVFDPLFPKETPLPAAGDAPLAIDRHYSPIHNVGHFRYLESSQVGEDGQPSGDITLWDEIRFPFDPDLENLSEQLDTVPVEPSERAREQFVEEAYQCDAGGTVTLTITNRTDGYSRSFRLGRWAETSKPVRPGRSPRRKKRRSARAGK